MITIQDKLGVVERMIVNLRGDRGARIQPTDPDYFTYQALKAIADDLRVRFDKEPGPVQTQIEYRVNAVLKAPTVAHKEPRLLALAHEVVSKWSTIKIALEQLRETVEQEQ